MTGADETLRRRPQAVGHALPGLLGDERLARFAATGDERAFAAIYRRYGADLHRYCRAMLGNSAEADDALQNTMVSAMRALPGERREIALKPWLFRVAHNEAVSLLRARRPVAEPDPDRLSAPGADATHAATERLRQLVGDLRRLPERQRGALVMRELNGMSFEELGASLGCSPAAARQVLYEARLALQQISEGREMQCDAARQAISERDGRMLRGRKLRAHLSECERCRDFRAAIFDRRDDLAQLAPPLAVPVILGLLNGLGSAGGAASTGTGLALGSSAAVKSATAALAAAAIGAGAAQVGGIVDLPVLGQGGAPAEQAAGSAPESGRTATGVTETQAEHAAKPGGAGAEQTPIGTLAGRAAQRRAHPGPPRHATATGQGTSAASSTAPGQVRTPPGQVRTPPGQVKSPPGESAAPPGPVKTPPGQIKTPPGQTKPKPPAAPTAAPDALSPSPGAAPTDASNGSGPPAHAQAQK